MKDQPTRKQLKPIIDKLIADFDFQTALSVLNGAGVGMFKFKEGNGYRYWLSPEYKTPLTIGDLKYIARYMLDCCTRFCNGYSNVFSGLHFDTTYSYKKTDNGFDIELRLGFYYHIRSENKTSLSNTEPHPAIK